jgi:hypothetical protein
MAKKKSLHLREKRTAGQFDKNSTFCKNKLEQEI